jgi:hypothetical protein
MICNFINETAPGLFAKQFDVQWEEKGSPAKAITIGTSNDLPGFQACKSE